MYSDTNTCKIPQLGGPMMKRVLLSFIIANLMTISAGYVYGHHSFAATYAEDKHATVEGKLVQFTFRNPHSFIQIDSKQEDGKMGGSRSAGKSGIDKRHASARRFSGHYRRPGAKRGRSPNENAKYPTPVRWLEVERHG